MATDTTMSVSPVGACSTKGNLPTLDKQQTSCGVSTAAQLTKQRTPYLTQPPRFVGAAQATLYGPIAGLIWAGDVFISEVSWNAPGGMDEIAEIRDGTGATIWRGVAQAVDDSNFACVKIERFAKGGYTVPVLDSGRLDIRLGRIPRNGWGGRS